MCCDVAFELVSLGSQSFLHAYLQLSIDITTKQVILLTKHHFRTGKTFYILNAVPEFFAVSISCSEKADAHACLNQH